MTSTVKIASNLPMALRISEPEPNPEKPGLTGPLRTAVLGGSNAPSEFGPGVTVIDKDLWNAFQNSEAFSAYEGALREVGDDDGGGMQFGFEPALTDLSEDKDNAKMAKQGSTLTGEGPVAAADMKTGSTDPASAIASPAGSAAAKAKPGK